MGFAYFSLGRFAESVDAYNKALELEPNGQTYKDGLAQAQKKMSESGEK